MNSKRIKVLAQHRNRGPHSLRNAGEGGVEGGRLAEMEVRRMNR